MISVFADQVHPARRAIDGRRLTKQTLELFEQACCDHSLPCSDSRRSRCDLDRYGVRTLRSLTRMSGQLNPQHGLSNEEIANDFFNQRIRRQLAPQLDVV